MAAPTLKQKTYDPAATVDNGSCILPGSKADPVGVASIFTGLGDQNEVVDTSQITGIGLGDWSVNQTFNLGTVDQYQALDVVFEGKEFRIFRHKRSYWRVRIYWGWDYNLYGGF